MNVCKWPICEAHERRLSGRGGQSLRPLGRWHRNSVRQLLQRCSGHAPELSGRGAEILPVEIQDAAVGLNAAGAGGV